MRGVDFTFCVVWLVPFKHCCVAILIIYQLVCGTKTSFLTYVYISRILWKEDNNLTYIHIMHMTILLFRNDDNEHSPNQLITLQTNSLEPLNTTLYPSTTTLDRHRTVASLRRTTLKPSYITAAIPIDELVRLNKVCQPFIVAYYKLHIMQFPSNWTELVDWHIKIWTFQANGLACQAKYEAGSIPSFAANASLFVKAHAY